MWTASMDGSPPPDSRMPPGPAASTPSRHTGFSQSSRDSRAVPDLYATGNYYTDITIEEYKKTNRTIWNETDSQAQAGTWYCVEGSCQHLRQILKDNKFMGGILVDQFYDNPGKLSETIEMNLRRADGLMVFDIVHIIQKNLWKEIEKGMREGGAI